MRARRHRWGDWSLIDGLASYSGGAWFRKTIELTADQTRRAVVLDLRRVVASAECPRQGNSPRRASRRRGKWTYSKFVHVGANRIEVLVFNTLANHYQTIPTRYRGSALSGLAGAGELRSVASASDASSRFGAAQVERRLSPTLIKQRSPVPVSLIYIMLSTTGAAMT